MRLLEIALYYCLLCLKCVRIQDNTEGGLIVPSSWHQMLRSTVVSAPCVLRHATLGGMNTQWFNSLWLLGSNALNCDSSPSEHISQDGIYLYSAKTWRELSFHSWAVLSFTRSARHQLPLLCGLETRFSEFIFKTRISILESENRDFRRKNITKDKESKFVLIKDSIHLRDKVTVRGYSFDNSLKIQRQNVIALQEEIGKSTINLKDLDYRCLSVVEHLFSLLNGQDLVATITKAKLKKKKTRKLPKMLISLSIVKRTICKLNKALELWAILSIKINCWQL